MKTLFCLLALSLTMSSFAAELDYLKKEDQQFYKNEALDGKNDLQRIDSTVKEINKVYGELKTMKTEIAELKKEIAALKAAK